MPKIVPTDFIDEAFYLILHLYIREETVEKAPNPNPIIPPIAQTSQLFLLFTKKVLTFERK